MRSVLAWAVTWIVISAQLVGCGQTGGVETEPRLQDPISEMGDAFRVDIDSLAVLKEDTSAPRIRSEEHTSELQSH